MSNKTSVVFLGGKKIGFECLSYLLESANSKKLEVVAVFTKSGNLLDEDDTVHSLAKSSEIPVFEEAGDLIQFQNKADYLISVQYHKILKKEHIDVAGKMAINLHMAPLPEYRGCNQFSFAILDEVAEFGTTIHRLEEGIDSGDVITERRFSLGKDVFVRDLYQKTYEQSLSMFKEEIFGILSGHYQLTPQSKLAESRASGFHLRKEIDDIKKINPEWPVEKQKRYFRATWFPPFAPPVNSKTGGNLDLKWYNTLS